MAKCPGCGYYTPFRQYISLPLPIIQGMIIIGNMSFVDCSQIALMDLSYCFCGRTHEEVINSHRKEEER